VAFTDFANATLLMLAVAANATTSMAPNFCVIMTPLICGVIVIRDGIAARLELLRMGDNLPHGPHTSA